MLSFWSVNQVQIDPKISDYGTVRDDSIGGVGCDVQDATACSTDKARVTFIWCNGEGCGAAVINGLWGRWGYGTISFCKWCNGVCIQGENCIDRTIRCHGVGGKDVARQSTVAGANYGIRTDLFINKINPTPFPCRATNLAGVHQKSMGG